MEPRRAPAATRGPAEWFTGEVFMQSLATPDDAPGVTVLAVHLAPGARTAWHAHAGGQTLYVTDGRGFVQSRGGRRHELSAGDVHVTADGEEHWHGATPDHLLAHLSITKGMPTWGAHVTDEEYAGGTN